MYRRFYGLLTTDMGFKYIISHCIVCHFKNCSCLLCLLLRGAYGTISQSLPDLSSFFLPRYIIGSFFFLSFFSLDRFSPALSWAIYSRIYRSPLVFLNSRCFKNKSFSTFTPAYLWDVRGQGQGVGMEQGWEKGAGGAWRWGLVILWPCCGHIQSPGDPHS